MSTARQEFIVTLKDYNLLENFYSDMENEGSANAFIPSRAVPCVDRRPASRNTHYLLTRDEARILAADERVSSVELKISNPSIKSQLHADQTGTWSRGDTLTTGDRNWALYRCLNEVNDDQWGGERVDSDRVTSTIKLDASGKNVDIIIVDEAVYPDHPEFGNRVIEYDWFGQHDSAVRGTGCVITHVSRSGSNIATITTETAHNISIGSVINVVCTSNNSFNATGVSVTAVGTTSILDGGDGVTVNTISYANTGTSLSRTSATGFWRGVYQYGTYDQQNNHATHVAGIIAGNTQGWAKEANIYNIRHQLTVVGAGSVNIGDLVYTPSNLIFNYIKEFHNSKSINPETGRKNPTLVNCSWGMGVDLFNNKPPSRQDFYNFSKIYYRDTETRPVGTPIDTGISGIFTATDLVSSLNSVAAGTANLIETTGATTGTVTSTTYAPNGRTGLSQSEPTAFTVDQYSDNDEAFWTLTPPFSVSYLGQSYSQIHVNANSYITFGGGFLDNGNVDASRPSIRKIFVSAGDRSCEDLWSGSFGVSPNRTFVVRWEGYEGAYSTTYETTPTVIWEMKFFEATPNTFELQIVENANFRAEFDAAGILQNGLKVNVLGLSPIKNTDIDADIDDLINDGIIVVGSAGNSGIKIDDVGGLDYDNYVVDNGLPIFYHRGSSPSTSHPAVICVGSIDSASSETKAVASNTGPRVDIFAPGRNIASSVFDGTGSNIPIIAEGGGNYQLRNGTSMACAQITGILALILESYPLMTPAEAKLFVTKFARSTVNDTEGGYDDNTSLQGSANRFAYYRKERPDNGVLIPKTVRYIRPDTGAVFPRPLIRRK
jgi:hypothetical protein